MASAIPNKSANKSSAVTGRRKGSLGQLSRRGAHFLWPRIEGRRAGGCRQPYLYATRRIILLIAGSLTRFRRREPFDLALLLFRPFLPLTLHLERKDAHFALDRPPVFRVGE